MNWPFDQLENVVTVTTRQVMVKHLPVLSVVHYSEDHSWAFTCGITNASEDLMLVGMAEVISTDNTLLSIADLPPGWCAERSFIGGDWVRYRSDDL
ncbi:hypothetical protein H0A36_11455 [Endozoicomonas sp. SM1973]|uniref:DUF2185 domain-containing protein n=1 Tax=Spartinivicinus marinus TaxID=2994442 RepID=A0A853IBM6_9GAMM|nr:hypothetical protein [Spartinivicinus marinus]MCX4026144.1 hypothetical protein [Spartinivicinus marinus]NYZ66625.1 hypothetical protein [Spartinivicinus marinus]